jgi:hypothetical protein
VRSGLRIVTAQDDVVDCGQAQCPSDRISLPVPSSRLGCYRSSRASGMFRIMFGIPKTEKQQKRGGHVDFKRRSEKVDNDLA